MNAAETLRSITIEPPRNKLLEEYQAALEPLLVDIETRAIPERERLAKTVLPKVRKIEAALRATWETYRDAKYAATAPIDRLFEQCFSRVKVITAPLTTELPAMHRLRDDVKAGRYVQGTGVGVPGSNPVAIACMREKILQFRRPNLAAEIAQWQAEIDLFAAELKDKIERAHRTGQVAPAPPPTPTDPWEPPVRRAPRRHIERDSRDDGLIG